MADGLTLMALKEWAVTRVKGVATSKKVTAGFAAIDPPIDTVYDLLTHYPRRYIDRTKQLPIRDLKVGEEAMIAARVKRIQSRRTRQGRSLVEADLFDGTSYLKCTFFNQGWRTKQLPVGTEAVFFGRLDVYRGGRQMTNPVVDLIGNKTGRIIPIYPQSEKAGLTTDDFAGPIESALASVRARGGVADPLTDEWRDRLAVIDRDRALRRIHLPESWDDHVEARRRLAVDELLRLQLTLVLRKRALERESKGLRHVTDGPLVPSFHARLPFDLTTWQRDAIHEIVDDLAGPYPMHRLLQGDVGSGKTVVAVTAMLTAVQGGYQAALMAPTEVLAEQHFIGIRRMLDGLVVPDRGASLFDERPLRVELLTSRTAAVERTKLHAALATGDVDILIGTHALLTEAVAFRSLGVVVIDEQHRFGVEQRAALRGKGDDPDVLVMTATPIPRTAAMTVYGDLDMTEIKGMPEGRTPIETTWARGPLEEAAAWDAVRKEVGRGHQAYVVCPLIDGSEKIEARSAEEELARLQAGELAGLRLAVLHGRVGARDKEATMTAFRDGAIDVLVATTVIEVGIDVPNATVMVIEDADRFGIAQLHQLRGRVGRGAAVSRCFLLSDSETPEATARLSALQRTTDGFELAEVDLELRGEGTILGTRQKGRSDLKLASLRRDKDLVGGARDAAFAITELDPFLTTHRLLGDEVRDLLEPEEVAFLFKS